MNELITVIVPVYNVEKYLSRCIESIINQTYKNLEIILVDDGSTDNSGKICEEYKSRDSRIKVIHKKNGGLSDARNAGIEIAEGQYIGLVDSDDYIDVNMYNKLLKEIKKNDADIIICNYEKVYDDTPINKKNTAKEENTKIVEKKQAIELLFSNSEINNYAWNKLYKKELFEKIRYPFGKKMEDLGTTYKLFDRANKIVYTNYVGYFYFQRENSILHFVNIQFVKDLKDMTNIRYFDVIKKYPQMKKSADMHRLKFIKYYFMHIAKNRKIEISKTEEFKKEYCFFKENYKIYKSELGENNFKEKMLYMLFYYALPLYLKIYEWKG